MPDTYRVGKTLGTTIYCNDEPQPCAIVMNCGGITGRELAARIVALLNAESAPIAAGESENPLAEIYRIATRALAEPGDHSGKLVAICTLIEGGFVPAVEGPKEWRCVCRLTLPRWGSKTADGYIRCQGCKLLWMLNGILMTGRIDADVQASDEKQICSNPDHPFGCPAEHFYEVGLASEEPVGNE